MNIIRDVTIKAKENLTSDDILLFTGARQAGKTTILKQLQSHLEREGNIVHFLNLEDHDYRTLLDKSPKNLFKIFPLNLDKKNFILIDEIQYLKNPSNFLKLFYDEYHGKIKLLVSGSSAFYIDRKFTDSLVGRKKIFHVSTLSFKEFLRFKQEISFSQKSLNNLTITEKEKVSLYYREYIVYGGYPRVVLTHREKKIEILSDIVYSYIKKDIYEGNVRHDDIFYKLLKILSSQIGKLVNTSELAQTIGVSKTAIDNYLYIMQKSFHIILLKPFYKNIRKELTKMPKIYFADIGLRNFMVNNFQNIDSREDRGPLLENAVFRQLAETYPLEQIHFWRTTQKNEVDFVIAEKEVFEVKSNPQKFKKNNYKIFFENYPEIDFSIVSLDVEHNHLGSYKLLNVWEI